MMPTQVEVVISVPRGGFIKRDDQGRFQYLSPLPCPFNYGYMPGTLAPDGDCIDAVVLGARLAAGARVTVPVRGMVDFTDGGQADPKWVCALQPLTTRQRRLVVGFFTVYGRLKGALNLMRGLRGATAYNGFRPVN